uniref:Hypothetical site-specific DNA endonuclease n=1 Tax=Pediastrum duplex TaxID=3105 RepID=A0A1W5RMN9_PEDDU|nr:hypothetical protein [Pediastrum duplex]YP_009364108.1 hypothetical site-specific DNA endonuclease [Pediastrum duplex]AQU64434.1 hypothetical protein [Pediastrum duplex]ARK36703.1 hypothetical site-specific DNA endonuclease [Pediastrum duplex]
MQLLNKIEQEVTTHVNNLTMTEDSFLGLHIGDGSFSIVTYINQKGGYNFRAMFTWNLTDCTENRQLLEAVKKFLESKNICFSISCWRVEPTYLQLQIKSLPECLKLVDLFEQWDARTIFPTVRLNQFLMFSEAIKLYLDPNFRNDWVMCSRLIDIKWKRNPGTNLKKKGSLQEDMIQLQTWFNNKD